MKNRRLHPVGLDLANTLNKILCKTTQLIKLIF